MFTKSIWNAYANTTDFPPLQEDITVDTAIIGAGITGISAGRLLADSGQQVAILEALKVGGGTSSHSTGNLYVTVDQTLSALRDKYDTELVKQVIAARTSALELIEKNSIKYNLDCDFIKCPWYLYAGDQANENKIDREFEVVSEAGLKVEVSDAAELPFAITRSIKLNGQAQFNPMRYVQGMANALQSDNCRIHEFSGVKEIEDKKGFSILHTSNGSVRATNVIHATHMPKGIMLVQTLLGPYREYGIACKLKGEIPREGVYWGYHGEGEKYSIRSYARDQERFLIVVGQPHKVGQAENNEECIANLEAFARKHFQVTEVVYRWGGQHYRPADLLPYIGKTGSKSNVFIACGFSTDGLVYGTLASGILADMIMEKSNPWSAVFDSTRNQPVKVAKRFVKENVNVFKEYLKDLPGVADANDYSDVAIGEGKIVEKDRHKLAVHRRDDGQLLIRSAVCTHMACIVKWNNAEKSWDCPCHGSRFQTDGVVLEGPALHPLHKVDIQGEQVKIKPNE